MTLLKPNRDAVARRLFFVSVVVFAFAYGVVATRSQLFPVPLMLRARNAADQMLEEFGFRLPWYYYRSNKTEQVVVHTAQAVAPGLTLISGLGPDEKTQVKVMDVRGRVVHSWRINWFELWPSPTHLSADLLPKSNAGVVHGVALASNGDLIFNFEELGMLRVNACGQVVWRLPYRTHHSIHLDEQGHIWTSGLITRYQGRPALPNYNPPFQDYTVLEISPDGKILRELPVADLLIDNGLRGLLYMGTVSNRSTRVSADTLHVNDVEVFPASVPAGAFSPGDVMISLRNINAILVFDRTTLRIKFLTVGKVLRQHDPDFVDGNTISVFDNNNLATWRPDSIPDPAGHYSRVVRISAETGQVDVRFSGSLEKPFFTDIMGKHQILPNGNTLLTEAIAGRVVEIDAGGNIIWEYFNLEGNGTIGMVDDALRLPPELDDAFFAKAVSACRTTAHD
jgi:hypothetical protein